MCVIGYRMAKEKEKKEIDDLSWIIKGKQRREIIKHFDNKPNTPSEIASKSKYSLNHTSRILNEFKKHKFAKLLNPKAKTGRLYQLTSKGRVLRDEIVERSRKNKKEDL
jgi:predicted transcriptional regulator